MRHYSVENDTRKTVVAVAAATATVAAILLYGPTNVLISILVEAMPSLTWLEYAGVIGALEPMVLFGLIWLLFDNVIWNASVFRRWHHIPYIGGTWVGTLDSSYENETGDRTIMPMAMNIKQTYSKMSVHCTFAESSESYAVIIGIVDCDDANDECTLEFSYHNKAIDDSVVFDPNRDGTHPGFNSLRIIKGKAVGNYATLRSKPTSGHIELTRKQDSE